jgi:hypothetical protein
MCETHGWHRALPAASAVIVLGALLAGSGRTSQT